MQQQVLSKVVSSPRACCVVLRQSRLLFSRQYSSSNDGSPYDMVIAGGGMVGTALACCIGQEPALAGKRVLLLEAAKSPCPPTNRGDAYSNRVCAISQGSTELLTSIGVWNNVTETRAKPFERMHVWDSCSGAFVTFTSQSGDFNISPDTLSSLGLDESHDSLAMSHDNMGHIVENNVLLHALTNQVEQCSGVEVRRGVAVDDIITTSDGPSPWLEVCLSDGSSVNARLLIGADGSSSRVRKLAGLSELSWSYSQSAVVGTLHLEEESSSNSVAWQRFLPSGPIALLPLSDSMSSLVWTTTPSHAKQLLQMEPERFVDAVNAALFDEYPRDEIVKSVNDFVRNILKNAVSSSSLPVRQLPPVVKALDEDSRGGFPLSLVHSPFYAKSRIALVGDAAHRVHPLAGLGVNLGFGDVSCLHRVLLTAASRGEDWGSLSSLKEYESSRQRHNVPVMATIDGLQRLFSTSWTPAVLLRSVGLQLFGALSPVKDCIISQAQKAN